MRFDEQVHWSEGLFIQPQHMQLMQQNLVSLVHKVRKLDMPFDYGFYDLELDPEALISRRVVIKRFSALMPDGTELSMPGNCSVEPLELSIDNSSETEVDVYLTVPNLSDVHPNINTDTYTGGRYNLREISVVDENTAENEIPVITRDIQVFLLTDVKNTTNCTYMHLCKLRWISINSGLPSLQQIKEYMPPFISVSADCPLLPLVSELIFQLKSSKNSILTKFDAELFDKDNISGSKILSLLQLRVFTYFERLLRSELVPGRINPYTLYLELMHLLSELESLYPNSEYDSVMPYDHDDLWPVFDSLLKRIRAILLRGDVSSALSFEFYEKDSHLWLDITDERVFSSKDIFLAIQFTGNLKDRIADVEIGDNFRLIDKASLSDRIRGVKLEEVRYPPQYLPNISHTLWFKLVPEKSERIWKYIHQEMSMVIDCAKDLFPDLMATLYVSVDSH
jgi:type VI secretion system ImpJ/VasE family protein